MYRACFSAALAISHSNELCQEACKLHGVDIVLDCFITIHIASRLTSISLQVGARKFLRPTAAGSDVTVARRNWYSDTGDLHRCLKFFLNP